MAQNRFASVPNISIPRSRFKQPFNHSTSFLHGDLVPIDCFEIIPGDTYKLNLASLVWMSNPIRPIFGNITAHVDVFFVPMRLVWQYTKEFFGENKTSSGYQTTDYKIPSVYLGAAEEGGDPSDKGVGPLALSAYLGKPICGAYSPGYCLPVSVLKERAYYEIWNNYYRAQQIQNPVLINYGGNGVYDTDTDLDYIGSWDGSYVNMLHGLMKVNKEFDYFTAATLYPQYGPAVSLPLGSFAPIMTQSKAHLMTGFEGNTKGLILGLSDDDASYQTGTQDLLINYTNKTSDKGGRVYPGLTSVDDPSAYKPFVKSNLVADLTNATAATINQLRYAFAVQKYLERSNFGSRYFEMLQVHYGVTSPDATLQIPQRIGHADFPINISTVLSTAGAAADTSTELGMPGATSCTGHKDYLFTHAFTEHGYLFVLLSTTHERSYAQGVLREDLRQDNFEFYVPEFANLGDQEVLNAELYYGDTYKNKNVFGYQEHWAEYRYRPHRVSGKLNPNVYQALDFWTLAETFNTTPSLDSSFIVEDRGNLARCLVTGSEESAPDYIGDFYFDYTATREMPLFTIPGLIDHFGSY